VEYGQKEGFGITRMTESKKIILMQEPEKGKGCLQHHRLNKVSKDRINVIIVDSNRKFTLSGLFRT